MNLFLGMDEESFKAKRDTMFFKTPEAGNFIFCYYIAFIVCGTLCFCFFLQCIKNKSSSIKNVSSSTSLKKNSETVRLRDFSFVFLAHSFMNQF